MINAADLSNDLGFGRHMPPEFWRWVRERNLEPAGTATPLAFDPDDVAEALEQGRGRG